MVPLKRITFLLVKKRERTMTGHPVVSNNREVFIKIQ